MSASSTATRWTERIHAFFLRQSRSWLIVHAFVLVLLIATVDYATGYEVAIFPFYSIAILMALWLADTDAAIFLSIFSTVVGYVVDRATGHHYSTEWLRLWDSVVRFIFFSLVLLAGVNVRRQRDENRAKIDLLERSRELEQEIINISELEQQRIGRDLHDSLGQHLVAIGLAAESLKDELALDAPRAAKAVGQFAELLHDAVNLARDLARGLSPVDRDEGGLESALEQLAARVSRLSGIACSFTSEGGWERWDNTKAVHVYRIAQEALNNAARHSKASAISISLATREDTVHLTIRDDGVGLDPSRVPGSGMGFNIMHYRSRVLGGVLTIADAHPGTVVECTVKPAAVSAEPPRHFS